MVIESKIYFDDKYAFTLRLHEGSEVAKMSGIDFDGIDDSDVDEVNVACAIAMSTIEDNYSAMCGNRDISTYEKWCLDQAKNFINTAKIVALYGLDNDYLG